MHDNRKLATVASIPESKITWHQHLAAAVRDPDELVDILRLPERFREPARRAARLFPLLVPRSFLHRIRPGDPQDPLLRQVLPLDLEESDVPGFETDPVGDLQAERAPGLLHKYRGRALLITSGLCAIHCRYCFRRHYPYDEAPKSLAAWEPAFRELAEDASLSEIILSGGDPLVLTDSTLARLANRLSKIPHLRRLRIHSRLPVVIPERVDDNLLGWLTATRLSPWFVVHVNHPREIDSQCAAALTRLVTAGVPVLNQSVLLSGVNDDPDTLAALSEKLVELRAMPYYLHQLDPVAGAAHFHVNEERGLEIVAELRKRLPGYAVPRYVREIPGAPHKIEIH